MGISVAEKRRLIGGLCRETESCGEVGQTSERVVTERVSEMENRVALGWDLIKLTVSALLEDSGQRRDSWSHNACQQKTIRDNSPRTA